MPGSGLGPLSWLPVGGPLTRSLSETEAAGRLAGQSELRGRPHATHSGDRARGHRTFEARGPEDAELRLVRRRTFNLNSDWIY